LVQFLTTLPLYIALLELPSFITFLLRLSIFDSIGFLSKLISSGFLTPPNAVDGPRPFLLSACLAGDLAFFLAAFNFA